MTQKEIDILYSLTISLHENDWFGKRNKPRDRNEVQKWVAEKLATCLDIYTIPCGASWGILVAKEEFEKYWNENSKILVDDI